MAHRKHHRGMKHANGTGRSRTLKARQRQIRAILFRRGWRIWDLPFEGAAYGYNH